MKLFTTRPNRRRGFTLVEVTLAMGIAATVIIALLGLIPSSMEQMRTSKDLTTASRISEEITNDAQLLEWAKIDQLDGETRNYDEEGTRLDQPDPYRHMYSALIEVDKRGVSLPGESKKANEFARRIEIHVGISKGKQIDLRDRNNPRVYHFSTTLARLDEMKKRKP